MSTNSPQWQQQLEGFTNKIEQLPSNPDNYLDRGNFLLQHGQLDLAIVDYSMAIDLNPKRFESYNSRGVAYSEKRHFPQALHDLNQAIKLAPTTPIIRVNRGIVHCLNDDHQQGIDDYNQALQLWMDMEHYPQQRQRWRAYHNRAVAYRQLGETKKSLEDMLRALILDPAQKALHLDLAKLYRQCDSAWLDRFFGNVLNNEEISDLPRLHQNCGQQLVLENQLKISQYLLGIYVQTSCTALVASLRSYTKQLLHRSKKERNRLPD